MYKDILVPLMRGEIHEPALRQACALAEAHGGHVAALVAMSLAAPIAAAWIYYPAGVYESMEEAAKATVRELAQAAERRLAGECVAHEVRQSASFWLTTAEVAALHARYADLTVSGVSRPVHDTQWRLLSGLLAGSGRPLLMVPEGATARGTFEHAVLAWKSSREAARALNDALPLLVRTRAVEVLRIEREDERAPTPMPDQDLLAHLRRHGVDAQIVHHPAARAATGEAIVAYARTRGADLIVAGGYSRARALEQVFGGVTRYLIEHADLPVLFSH